MKIRLKLNSFKFKHPVIWLESRPKVAWSLVAVYAILIFVLSSFPYGPPEPGITSTFPATYKHVIEYSILGFLLLAAFRSNGKTKESSLLFAILLAGFYGLTDEFHQLFVLGRTASIYDVAADLLGSFFGAILTKPRKPRQFSRLKV